jgi:hypothetical protein
MGIRVLPVRAEEVSVFNRILQILAVVCLVTTVGWATESPFIGQWKLDPEKTRMPDEMKVQSQGANKYSFNFGGAVETILVDGSDQPGCCGTQLSVKPEAANTWIVERKKDGKLLLRATWKLSKDQSTLTDFYREFGVDGGETNSMDYVYQRTGSNGSGFAADWQSIKETMNSPYSIEVKEFDGDGLSFITPDHQTTNVKLDGKDYPSGRRGVTFSMRQVDERKLEKTVKADGKVIETDEIGLSDDRKMLTISKHIPSHKETIVMVFERK